ncbi:MAG: metallophosphoesterase [Acidobacteriota bacterium]|nr:metallophosphoesterase [Acidobacteriota bacterium]
MAMNPTGAGQMNRRGFLRQLGCAAGAFVLGGSVIESLWEPDQLRVTRVSVAFANLPPSFEGLRIAQLTDVHHGPTVSLEFVQRAVEMANGLEPDLVALTGDYVYRGTEYIPPCMRVLGGLHAPLGVLAVLGNHDHWHGASLTREWMARVGIADLTNAAVPIRRGDGLLWVAGVGDLWEDTQRLDYALADAPANAPVLLLSHNPDYGELLTDRRVGLMLAGHTHGGQVNLPLFGPPILPLRYGRKYAVGLVRDDWKQAFVSRGVGTIIPAIRFRCRPEVALITLTRASQGDPVP